MNIGWFTYQPGLQGNPKSSAGGASWTRYLFDEFHRKGHNVFWFADGNAPTGTTASTNVKDVDVLVINWRWMMPDYPDRNALYLLQKVYLEQAIKHDVRVVVHDQDLLMSIVDYEFLIKNNVQIYAPELRPLPNVKELHFPFPFDRVIPPKSREAFLAHVDLMYIGNVYDRYWDARKFFAPFSVEHKTAVYGNWLEPGPDRPNASLVQSDMPNVEFRGRLNQKLTVDMLADANSTIHLFKMSYAPCGFLTLRWAEAAAAYTPAFVPSNFWMPEEFKRQCDSLGLLVRDGAQMAEHFERMSEIDWFEAARIQRKFVMETMSAQRWFDVVENKY